MTKNNEKNLIMSGIGGDLKRTLLRRSEALRDSFRRELISFWFALRH